MKTAKLSVLPIKDLNPAEYNPRKRLKPGDKEYEKIKHSIEEFGFADPVVVNSDMTIIGGHQRVTVAAALGYTEVPCAIVEVSKTQEKALNIALNKISGEWNQELLADLIQDLQDSDFDVGFTGFEPPEIEQLFSKVHDKKVKEDDFNVEAELKKPTVAQTGDVWLLGKHRVICGDSILPETYSILMDGRKANLILTDPPYNVDVEETAGKIKNDNMADEDFYKFLFAAFVNMEQNMEDDASIYVFHADTEGLNFRKAFADAGFKLSGCCIWKKNALVLGRSPYQWRHEPCLYGWKEGAAHYFINDRTQDTVILEDDIDFSAMKKNELVAYLEELRRKNRDQTSVIYENKPTRNDIHPTMKPIALVGKFITNSSKSGWNVLDLFGGSGSTLMAAEQLGRTAFIMELDERFCDVIVKRWEDYTGQQAVRIPAEDVK